MCALPASQPAKARPSAATNDSAEDRANSFLSLLFQNRTAVPTLERSLHCYLQANDEAAHDEELNHLEEVGEPVHPVPSQAPSTLPVQ